MFKKTIVLAITSLLFLNSYQVNAEEKLDLKLGGFLRFNYNLSSWKDLQQKRGGDFAYDCLGLKVKATYDELYLNAEYRLYSDGFGGGFLRHGYAGYLLKKGQELKFGLIPVPFGNSEFNSNSFFFSLNYYYGLEGDNDMGISYSKTFDKLKLDFAIMKNGEDLSMSNNGDASYSRYGYDVSSMSNADGSLILRNKEINQFNARAIYQLKHKNVNHNIGISAMWGQILNLDTEKIGSRYAIAAHYNANIGKFNIKAQVSNFNHNAKNPSNEPKDVIAMAAYGAPYLIAKEATSYTLGVTYTHPVKSKIINSLSFYNDFGMANKSKLDFENSMMNVTGMAISAGPIYTYVDWAMGKNHAWLGPDWTAAFANGNPNAEWNYRLNINFGFYF